VLLPEQLLAADVVGGKVFIKCDFNDRVASDAAKIVRRFNVDRSARETLVPRSSILAPHSHAP
jgi:hypothetical protein